MHDDLPSIECALRDAADVRGIGELARVLGYELIEPPDGVALNDGAGGWRLIASGGGISLLAGHAADRVAPAALAAHVRTMLNRSARPVLLALPTGESLAIATGGLDGRPRLFLVSRQGPSPAELETLAELAARDDGALAALARHARSLSRSSLTRRFFRDFRARRDAVSVAWTGIDATARRDRDQLALLFLSRVVFLYFLQKQGHLLGRQDYLIGLVRDAALRPEETSIFRRVLGPLFFGVLNRAPERRDGDALRLGELPYLNGGLFEPHALERAHPELDLPDEAVIGAFDGLFERYRFTTGERQRGSATGPAGIQPEMLGRMFEGLMAADQRERTGTFYTPGPVVERIVRRGLRAWLAGRPGMDWRAAGMVLREPRASYGGAALLEELRAVRVIDPACGSGAFVLGALEQLARLRGKLGDAASADDVRRELAAESLHGVDLEPDAALLCALRLWLALTPAGSGAEQVRPLPNLDHRVRQGDALLDPLDLAARGDTTTASWQAAALDAGVRRARRCLRAHVERYGAVAADDRAAARVRIGRAEARLARRWIDAALRRVDAARRDAHARARGRDLFGDRQVRSALRLELRRLRQARAELARLGRRLLDARALPFFSFALHFGGEPAHGGFDLVLSNPPWVRSHRWPRAVASLVRTRYRVCEGRAWYPASAGGRAAAGQVDLALLFVERGLDLLRPGGVLAMLLPSKSFRSLSAGAARALVSARARIVAIEDHALRHRAIFRDADAFAGVLVARVDEASAAAPASDDVRVVLSHRTSGVLRFRVPRDELPLEPGDTRSPWLLAPAAARAALRTMLRNGTALGAHPGLVIRRGAMTGANDALLFAHAERKLGDAVVAWRAVGAGGEAGASSLLHVQDLCPALRGAGIRPFRFEIDGWVAWCHDDETALPRPASRRLARALAPVRSRLRARTGWRPHLPDGVLFRLDRSMLRPRVAWRDIATDLEVACIPARVRCLGAERPLIALNTVYFIAVDDEQLGFALAALLASLPSRVFARTIAERAKDARFRFFAWVLAALPLPRDWMLPGALRELADLGERAHAAGGVDAALGAGIDDTVRRMLRLSRADMAGLHRFDDWLVGRAHAEHLRRTA